MAVSRSQMPILLEDLSGAEVAHLQLLEEEQGVSPQEDAFQRYLRSIQDLLSQYQIAAPKIFISHSLEVEENGERTLLLNFLKRLSQNLRTLGLSVFFDLETAKEQVEARMRDAIVNSDYFLVVGTPVYKQKSLDDQATIALEYQLLMEKISQSPAPQKDRMLVPVCYSGSFEDAFPENVPQCPMHDFRDPQHYYQSFIGLDSLLGLVAHLYPALSTNSVFQSPARFLLADFERALALGAQGPRAHAQSLPEQLRRFTMDRDEMAVRQKSHSLIAWVRRTSLFSSNQTDNRFPLLVGSSDPLLEVLEKLGIDENKLIAHGISRSFLNPILDKELSYATYLRWAAVDHFSEKMLQGLLLSQQDLDPSMDLDAQNRLKCFLKWIPRQMPKGRSLLLKSEWSLKKAHAARGLIRTTDLILIKSVNLFISIALSYRLYEIICRGHADFSEFRNVFGANDKRGIKSLVHLLSGIDATGLWLLLFSPLIAGTLKGLWDTRRSKTLSGQELLQLQQMVEAHVRPLQGLRQKVSSYLWDDTLRQIIPMPYWNSVSDCIQKAEQRLRWDGRVRADMGKTQALFENIERLALQGRGFSQMTAMQSLAKIIHSLSIRDFSKLQVAGYSQEILLHILAMKTKSLEHLYALGSESHEITATANQTLAARLSPANRKGTYPSRLYAHYFLWWLGMSDSQLTKLFLLYKASKLGLQGLFLKTIIDSILELIACPDKKGFRMFYGDYPVWANQLTPECFQEFVRRFRLISKTEPIDQFIEQLKNFDLRSIDILDLSNKALTGNEIRDILVVFNQKMALKTLVLVGNTIKNETSEIVFPKSLLVLDLHESGIDAVGTQRLKLPVNLQELYLEFNKIGPLGVQGLELPPRLEILNLQSNKIGPEGIQSLKLPSSLQTLYLDFNNIGSEGAWGLNLTQTPSLQTLHLSYNEMRDVGAQGLQLPTNLRVLNLIGNQIGPAGAQDLKLPQSLQVLSLSANEIGPEGAQRLQLPVSLEELYLGYNGINATGARGLNLTQTPSLQKLDLKWNPIGPEGAQNLKLPPNLRMLDLSNNGINGISDEGAQGLWLPTSLKTLYLSANGIGAGGVQGLRLPLNLQTLDLSLNPIGFVGARALLTKTPNLQTLILQWIQIGPSVVDLKLPSSLRSLDLVNNIIGPAGAKGLKLPASLQSLDLSGGEIRDEGASGLQLPVGLQILALRSNQIGNAGTQGLQLPTSLQTFDLSDNQVDTIGVRALVVKIGSTNISRVDLSENPYNTTLIDLENAIQQGILIKLCQDQLCHANTPLQEDPEASSAPSPKALLLFSSLKKPFTLLSNGVNSSLGMLSEKIESYFTGTLNSVSSYLRSTLSDCPSYFPNINSAVTHDWSPQGAAMLSQFQASLALSPSLTPLPMPIPSARLEMSL